MKNQVNKCMKTQVNKYIENQINRYTKYLLNIEVSNYQKTIELNLPL